MYREIRYDRCHVYKKELVALSFNQYRRSSHGGCPVLGGSKWILNKWLFGYDQVQEWRCGLKKKDTFEGFAKYY